MIRKKNFLVLLFMMSVLINNAQSNIELARKYKEMYPDEAVVVTNSSTTFEFKRSGTKMIGIEKSSYTFLGLEKNQKFEFPVFYSTNMELDDIEADGGYVTSSSNYDSDGIFHNDIKYRSARYNIDKFGSEKALYSELVYSDLRYLNRVYINDFFNAVNRQIEFIIPDNLQVDLIPINFEGYSITKSTRREGSKKIITYSSSSIEKYSDEPNIPGLSHIYPHIIIRVLSYTVKNNTTRLFNSIDDLYEWYAKLVNEIDEEPEKLKPLVEELTADKESDIEKISAIYYWVQDNIRYIAFEDGIAGFKPESCQKVHEDMYGDCKGMSNLTKHMLKLAGFDARLAWVGTRKLAYDYSFPSLVVDNHVICALFYNESVYYLDPTIKFLEFGNVHQGIQGKNTLIENGDTYLLEKIPGNNALDNSIDCHLQLKTNEFNQLTGTLKMELSGEAKINFVNLFNAINSDDKDYALKRYLARFNELIQVSDVDISEIDRSKALRITAHLNILDKVSEIEDELYIYPDPFQLFHNSDIDTSRKVDYWFKFKRNYSVKVNLLLPEGYKIESMHEPIKIEGRTYKIHSDVNVQNNSYNYSMAISLTEAELAVNEFDSWNKHIKTLDQFYNYPIILNKND